ncbi:hypothetical protein [Streptomyces sp. NBC_00347]|uniref:hypothetical protein n=1 Tax=Streptomyces sp. NBC_00347 TaxID=2975721 RepID=UPI00225BC20A|nr:hypothetical protein [Streptomyces sp. NBC_00347]MCX5122167.1 hypothetical protein [Streptomyces sp. NBC_00347]
MSTPGPQGDKHRSWPYSVTAVLVLALQQDWEPRDVAALGAVLLVLIALVQSAGSRGE